MDVLVDYYNLPQHQRRKGVVHVVDRMVSAIVPDHVGTGEGRIDLRLYGGWYEGQTRTRDAETIVAALREHYPTMLGDRTRQRKITVNVDLAYSMKCDPANHLWYTLRPRTSLRGIEFPNPSSVGCRLADRCPLRPGYEFLALGVCPDQGCEVMVPQAMKRREQKLVDTMLAADVFFNAYRRERRIAVVSSDDDLWPAIRTALQLGVEVIHVHTLKGYSTKPSYIREAGAGYVQVHLSEGAG